VAEARRGLTRRRLLSAGGLGAAGAALGAAGIGPAALGAGKARAQSPRERPNALLIVVDGVRADFVGAYDDSDERAQTPSLDALAGESLRFDRAIPDAMPAFPSRRGLLTGMRAYPFRDWRPTKGLAQFPGWNPIWDHQPLLTEQLQAGGVTALYVSDNPLLDDARLRGVVRKPAGGEPAATQITRYLAPALPGGARQGEPPAARVVRGGIEALEELGSKQPFFLGVDVFDRIEAIEPTPLYARRLDSSPENAPSRASESAAASYRPIERVDPVAGSDGRVRDNYATEVTAVDREIGRLLDRLDALGLAESTVVYFVSATTLALGEHGIFGMGAAGGHEDAYRAAYMIRDPEGRRAGETSPFHASTPDVAPTLLSYMGLTIPGKMKGEDLTALLDEDDLHPRPSFAISIDEDVVASNGRYVLVASGEGRRKRLFDTDPDQWEDDHSGDDDYRPRDEDKDVSAEQAETVKQLWQVALTAAGGTLPKLGPDGPIRPRPEIEDDDEDADQDEGRLDRDDDLNFMGR